MDDDDYIDEPVFQQSINAFAQAGFAPLGLGTLDVLGMNKKSGLNYLEMIWNS